MVEKQRNSVVVVVREILAAHRKIPAEEGTKKLNYRRIQNCSDRLLAVDGLKIKRCKKKRKDIFHGEYYLHYWYCQKLTVVVRAVYSEC